MPWVARELYVMINADSEALPFQIQEGRLGQWQRIIDTSVDSPEDFSEPGAQTGWDSMTYLVKARSVVVLTG